MTVRHGLHWLDFSFRNVPDAAAGSATKIIDPSVDGHHFESGDARCAAAWAGVARIAIPHLRTVTLRQSRTAASQENVKSDATRVRVFLTFETY